MEKEGGNQVKQEEIHDLLFTREVGWQEIIYDLINTEQLDPWNIDLIILSDKFLTKIENLEEADFFVSSKVLLAAALLLRIKSEILLNKYIKSIDEVLFGSEEKKSVHLERIELDEDIPDLVPRSPMPRFRKVTLQELMDSLNKAIVTENRRIRKEITYSDAIRETGLSLPKKTISIKNRINQFHINLKAHFNKNKGDHKVSYTVFIGKEKQDRINAFGPLLHLENSQKVWLEQSNHFEEIHIWLKDTFLEHNPDPFADIKKELEETENLDDFDESNIEMFDEE